MELNLLLLFMAFAAIIAVESKGILSAVVALAACGFALSLAFLILNAPGLAFTQLVVEVLCLVILIRLTAKNEIAPAFSGRQIFNTVCAIIFVIGFFGFAYLALKALPVISLSRQITEPRIADTLAEAGILFTAIAAIIAVMRVKGRKKAEERDDAGE